MSTRTAASDAAMTTRTAATRAARWRTACLTPVVSARSRSSARASSSRSRPISRRTTSAVLDSATVVSSQRLTGRPRLRERLLGKRRRRPAEEPTSDERPDEGREHEAHRDDQEREPQREERLERRRDGGEPEAEREHAEDGRGGEERDPASERGDLAVELDARKLCFEPDERSRTARDLVEGDADAVSGACGHATPRSPARSGRNGRPPRRGS